MSAERQKTILLVEDEVITALSEKMTLEKYGYKVITAYTGEEAVAAVEKTPGIDLILMDIDLGRGMDGTEAAAIILSHHDLPVVFLSSHTEPEVVEKTEKITSYGYVVKNSSSTVLDASIKMAFKLFAAKSKEKEEKSRREAALEAMLEGEEELRHLFKSMINAFVLFESIFDADGNFVSYRFVSINDAFERITGVKNEEVKGKSVHEVWPETEPEWIRRYGEVAVTGVSSEFELYHDPTKKLYHCNVYRPWDKRDRFCVVFEDITDRKQAEAVLRGSEERYRALFDRSLDLIYIHDFAGRFIDANEAALNRLGYNREEIRGLNFTSLLSEDQLPLARKTMQEIRETGFQKDLAEFKLRHKNGSAVYVETKGSAILSQGAFSAIQSIARDISARKQAEESLAQQNDALSKLNRFSIELSMLSAEDDLEALIAKRIKEIAGAELAIFSEYDPDNRTTAIRHIEMEPGLLKKVVGLLGKQVEKIHSTVSAEMYQEMTKEIIGTRKTLHEVSFGAISRPAGAAIQALLNVDRFIGIAYLVEGKLFGTSVLAMNKDQPDPAQPILENFSYLTSMSLRRKRAESQREAALEKLRSFALAVESSSDAIGMSTPAGKHYYQNKAFTDLFGDIGENPPATVYVDEQVGREVFRTIMGGNPWVGEIKMKGKTGELLDVFQRAYAIKDSAGRILSLVGVHTNINERKQAESQREAALEALRESEDRYRDLVENSQDLICTHDLEGKVLSMNETAVRLTGYPLKDLLNMNMADLLLPEVRHLFKPYLAEIQAKGEARGTMRVQTASGEPRYWEFYNTLRDKGVTTPVVRGVGRDITERERAEKIQQVQYNIANAMIKAETLSDFLETVRSELSSLIDTTNFLLALYDEASGMLSAPFERDEKDAIAQWPAEKSLTGLVIRQKRSMWLSREQTLQMFEAGTIELIGTTAESWLGVPLQINEKVLGAIVVQSYDKAYAYDQSSVRLMEMIASQLSVYIERKQAEEEIKRQLAGKEILLKEVHHRIKNNIASIAGLITLRLQSVSNPEAAAVLKEAIARVDSMRLLYDKLLFGEGYKDISVKNYLDDLIDTIIAMFPEKEKITIRKQIADFPLDAKRLFPLGSIINELLTNIMKYAFRDLGAGSIKIALAKAGNRVTLTVQDNGIGLPDGFDVKEEKGLGLMLVKMLSQQLGGSFAIEDHAGVRCTVAFDI